MLTMIEPSAGEGSPLRANLRLGAITLARHQLGVVLALGCERIVCLTHRPDDDIAQLRDATEAVGARFHLITEPRALVGLVTTIDEVVALGDGLLAWPATLIALLEGGPAVLVQPVEAGIVAGFERLDLNNSDAGACRLPGRLVQRLAELPADCDGFSTLQRIALQGGVPQRPLPAAALAQGQWTLVRSEAEAQAAEADWIGMQTGIGDGSNISLLTAQCAVRRLGPALLHAGSGNLPVAAAAGITALLALVAGGYHLAATGLMLAAIAWLLLCAVGLLARVEREMLSLPSRVEWRSMIFGWLADAVLVVLMVQNVAHPTGRNILEQLFAPLVLLGLRRLVPRSLPANWARWAEDRGLLTLILAVFAAAGQLGPGIDVTALLLLVAGLYRAWTPPDL